MANLKQVIEFIGKDSASPALKGLSKNTDGLQKTFGGLLKIAAPLITLFAGKKLIDAYDGAAKAADNLSRQTQRLGLDTKALIAESARLQGVTLFGDDTIQNVQATILKFDRLKNSVNDLTPVILDISASTGQAVEGVAQRIGVALNEPTKGLRQLRQEGIVFEESIKNNIEELEKQGDVAGAQALIIKELEDRYKGAASAATDTLSGALVQLQNNLGDTAELGGALGEALGKGFAKDISNAVAEFNKFATSAEVVSKVDRAISNLVGIFTGTASTFKKIGSSIYKDLIEPLAGLVKPIFTLGNFADTLSFVGNIAVGLIKGVKQLGQSLYTLAQSAYDAGEVLAKALNPTEWKNLSGSWDKLKSNWQKNINEIVKTGEEGAASFQAAFSNNSGALKREMEKAAKDAENAYSSALARLEGAAKSAANTPKEAGEEAKKSSDFVKQLFSDLKEGTKQTKALADVFDDLSIKINQGLQTVTAGFQSTWNSAFNLASQSLDNQLTELQNHNEKVLSELEKRQEQESASLATKNEELNAINEEWYQSELARILANVEDIDTRNERLRILEEEKVARETATAEQAAADEKALLEKQAAEKEALEKEIAIKEWEIRKKQFDSEQAQAISNVWISAALGIMKGFEMGPIAGGILAAITLAMAAAQTAVIAQQPAPVKPFKSGGYVPASTGGTQILAGEGGQGEFIIPENQMNNLTGGGNIYINNLILKTDNIEELRSQLLEIKRQDGSIL